MATTMMQTRSGGRAIMVPVQKPIVGSMPTKQLASGGEVPDGLRIDDQPLFDRQVFTPGVYRQMLFFNLGQNNGRTIADTNVRTPNRIPGEFTFSTRGVAVNIWDDPSRADFFQVSRGVAVLKKSQNERFVLRVPRVGGGGGFSGIGQGQDALLVIQNGTPSANDFYRLRSFIPYQAEDAFGFVLMFPGAGITLVANTTIEVCLYGMRAGLIDRN